MKSILCMTLAMASLAAAESIPSFLGTWKGTATTVICGKTTGTTTISMRLSDESYRSAGQVSGPLTLSGSEVGYVALDYDKATQELRTSLGSRVWRVGNIRGAANPFTEYNMTLKAGESYAGVGRFQSLTGILTKADAGCSNMGDLGATLKVVLKKQ